MSIKDLKLTQTREDGKKYNTTLGTREEDAQKQRELMYKKQIRKAKWAKWRKKWTPRIIEGLKILAIIAVVGVLLYFLFWIIIIGIGLIAVGSGLSDVPTNDDGPRYWRG